MSGLAIEACGLGKRYLLGETSGVGGLLARLAGRTGKAQVIEALADVSFTVPAGQAVGIIGSNGAGKSTLLKILTRITAPSSGSATVRGRLGTILEVGTGFHPELTGRENVFLSGAILGLRGAEVGARLDAIIAFAGVDRFIDTPVKRYSSGMYVRLAFSVAAHLDPDILVVDEVLAVGDIGFQKRCLQRMEEESQRDGRTILFVSHNLQAIRALCPRALLMEGGRLVEDGPTGAVIQSYLSRQKANMDLRNASLADRANRTAGRVRLSKVAISDTEGVERWNFTCGERVVIAIEWEAFERVDDLGLLVSFLSPGDGSLLTNIKETLRENTVERGTCGSCRVVLESGNLRPGSLALSIALGNCDFSVFDDIVDSNVNLPFLDIDSEEADSHRRMGSFSIGYALEAQ
jgi:lipopolysaccharide transport system ATP-binding protein